MAIPDNHKGKYIFHFTDLRNLDSIVKNGLLCTNEKNKLRIKHQNIANQTIQKRRAKMDVTAGPGGKVHDYVPFYFSSINPMLLTLLNHKNCDQNLIIYLCINITRLDKADAVFTSASANTIESPDFYDDPSHLDDLDWDLIFSRKWKMEYDEDKHKKMAEALIYCRVDVSEIDAIVVYNESVKKRVQQIFNQNEIKAPVILLDHNHLMQKYGFYYTKFFFSDRQNETLVTGPRTLLSNYKELIEEVHKGRQDKKRTYPYKTVETIVETLNQDITKLPELKAVAHVFQDYTPHNNTVGEHTKKVVVEMQKTDCYKKSSDAVKNVLLLGAYLHDIGKGPASKWKDGKMKSAYPDHPADAIPMLGRILIEDIEFLNDDEIRWLCMLVVYHDLIGECCERERDKLQIVDLIECENDYDILTAISIADASAINDSWGRKIIRDAVAMRVEVMKLKNE